MIQQSTAIEKHILRYFTELYTENEPANDEQIDDLFECDRVVPENDEINEACVSEISTSEILTAIRTSAPKKSPEPEPSILSTVNSTWC